MQEYEYNPVGIESREQFVAEAKDDPYSSVYTFEIDPREIFDFEVVEAGEKMSWGESYIGGPLGCVTDYGRHWDLSDEELIEKVVERWSGHMTPQFLGFMDDENEIVSDKVVIVRKENGYVKTAPVE